MIKKLASHLGEYKRAAILTPMFSALEAVMDILLPTIMAFIIDLGIEKGDMNAIVKYGLLTFAVAAIALLLGVLAGKYAAEASTGFAGNLRDAMYENIQHYSFSNIDKFSTAGLVTRMTTDVTNLQNAFQMMERMCVRAPVHLVFALIMAFSIGGPLTLIFVVAIAFLLAVLASIMVPTFKIFDRVFKNYDNLNSSVQENVSAIRVVKSFVREGFENEKYTKACEGLYQQFVNAESRLSFNNPAMLVSVYGYLRLQHCPELVRRKVHPARRADHRPAERSVRLHYEHPDGSDDAEHGFRHDLHVRCFRKAYRGSPGREDRPAPRQGSRAGSQGRQHPLRPRHLQVQARLRPACPERHHL